MHSLSIPSGIKTLEKILRNVSNRVVLHNCPTPIGPIDSNGDDDDCDDDVRVDRQLVRMGYRFLVRGCKGL